MDLLEHQENFNGLVKLNRELVAEVKGVASPDRVMLDMESSESPVYREQVRIGSQRILRVGLLSSPDCEMKNTKGRGGTLSMIRADPSCEEYSPDHKWDGTNGMFRE